MRAQLYINQSFTYNYALSTYIYTISLLLSISLHMQVCLYLLIVYFFFPNRLFNMCCFFFAAVASRSTTVLLIICLSHTHEQHAAILCESSFTQIALYVLVLSTCTKQTKKNSQCTCSLSFNVRRCPFSTLQIFFVCDHTDSHRHSSGRKRREKKKRTE